VIGWAFASTILFGSIYTGWHYAVDGYLSAILSTAIWLLLSRFYRLPIFKTSG
jgi:membrane-associated phospholipid phosphatase